jgi:predicted enzyme related to lactoylglutathione lyase
MPVTPKVQTVVINCADLERQVAFWSALLDVGERVRVPGFVFLEPQQDGGVGVALQEVADPTPGRNRVHLDTDVEDMAGARARIEELGGRHLEDHEIAGFQWSVMTDPEGNEFCIATHG